MTFTPLFTLLFSSLLSQVWPASFAMPQLNLLGYVGAFTVVAGAMCSAIGHRLWVRENRVDTLLTWQRTDE